MTGRIKIIRKTTSVVDGRRQQEEQDFFSCWCDVKSLGTNEKYNALQIGLENTIVFETRACDKMEEIRLNLKEFYQTGENGANTEPQEAEDEPEDKVIIPQGKMKVTVICDGSLNIRRSAAWGNENICGRAIRGQSYYVKEIHVVDGKKMVRTIGDLYLSGESEHVQFEQL